MHYAYMITADINSEDFSSAINQLTEDIANEIEISQVFFYGEATKIGTLENHSEDFQAFIDSADDQDIPLHICSAAFQRRQYQLSELGHQDFRFMGLGQFIVETTRADKIRVY